jgi:penicillin V acylase-like amidase (Ntn superfamily)
VPLLADASARPDLEREDLDDGHPTGPTLNRMCTRAMWHIASRSVLVGRNMDWATDTHTNLWALPRGMVRDNGVDGSLTWTSRYGSLVAGAYDLMTVDGLNEAGLAAHQLFLPESHYGTPDPARPTLSVAVWMQYVLDNFGSVAEAVDWIGSERLAIAAQGDPFSGRDVTLHLALDDASGDSAIIEYLDDTPTIHHGRSYTVMTNSPPFDEQLIRLSRIHGLGGDDPLLGGTESDARFARAAFYLERLPEPADALEAVASLLSVLRNTAQPFRVPDGDKPFASQTQWTTLIDFANGVYVFESKHRPNIVWVRLAGLDFSAGAPAMKLDLVNGLTLEAGLVGDVTGAFAASDGLRFLPVA